LRALAELMRRIPELRDSYGTLLTGIRLNASSGASRSILVTSAQPNEGKTTVASCLAIVASRSGQTVLLVDGDLRRPSLASAAAIENGVGFSEVIGDRVEITEAINRIELFADLRVAGSLSVMGAGQKAPEFFATVDWDQARRTVQAMTQRFDLVLFDSPPILAGNDALLLAGIVDGVLLVVGAGSADREEVRRAKEQLAEVGTPMIGAVFNQFDQRIHGRASQPYSKYYLNARQ
jgi:receptor protein-tyrosine kinase